MTALEPAPAAPPPAPPQRGAETFGDRLFRAVCRLSGWAILVTAAALVVVLLDRAWPALSRAGELKFFSSTQWAPGSEPPVYGSLAFVWGTLATTAIAMTLAVPLGVASAAYLSEIAGRTVRRVGSFLIELLAAIPSVIYGFWGVVFLAPAVQSAFTALGGPNRGGRGLLTAGLVLAIMIVPYVTAISFDVMRAVPRSQREGALALGATRWQMIRTAVLPYARPGIVAACFLALGRALGETMAVTMLIGNQAQISLSPFALGDSIASVIAKQFGTAETDLHRSALVALGLVLFVVTAAINVLARLLLRRIGRPRARRPWVPRPAVAKPSPSAAARARRAAVQDRVMTGVLGGALVLTVIPLFLILGYITVRGATAVDWNFFTKLPRGPTRADSGLAHALVGSGILVGLAALLATPVGLLTAILLAEFRNSKLATAVRFVVELLGGVPSIVIGIFAYAVLVPPIGTFSAWAGAFALAIIMIPVVVRAGEEALRLVPQPLRDASYALGATQRQTTLRVVVPAALSGVVTGICLAASRIAGETAPLLLTAFGFNYMPQSLDEPTPFLPQYIYTYSTSGYPVWERQAWAAALVLLVVVLTLNVGIRLLAGRREVQASRAG